MKKWKRYVLLILLLFILGTVFPVYAEDSEEDTIAERKEKAAQLGLSDWVDEEGYLIDSFYDGKNDQILTDMGLDGLVKTITDEELDAYVARLNAGISLYTVTRYEKVSQINPSTGGTLYTGIFEVDGRLAYCIERSAVTPAKGASTGSWVSVTNDNLRKVLYYGYNGPAAKGYTYVETALAAGEANGDGDNSLGRNVLAEIKTYASPPSSFKVWKVETNSGSTQDLAFYTIVENGYAQIKKVSANTTVTAGNENYSLAGAVFGVYLNSACTTEKGRLTTNASGISGTLQLSPGTYYVKEITAPKGFIADKTVRTIKISSSATTTITVSNTPQTVTPDIVIQKADAETGEIVPQENRTFKDAQFLVKFYCGEYEEGIDPAEQSIEADKEWIFKTDETGTIYFSETYLISGDSFWTNTGGQPILPLGTVTIQEIHPPEGYFMNPEVFVKKIGTSQNGFSAVTVSEKAVEIMLQIKKVSEYEQPLAGAEFVIYSDKECTQEIARGVSEEDGTVIITDLAYKSFYYVKEVKAPEGYRLRETVYEISTENPIEDTIIYLEVENESQKKLPNTGTQGIYGYCILGSTLCIVALKKGGIKWKKDL